MKYEEFSALNKKAKDSLDKGLIHAKKSRITVTPKGYVLDGFGYITIQNLVMHVYFGDLVLTNPSVLKNDKYFSN